MDGKSQKKEILQRLIQMAMSSTTGRGLEATIDGIKKAIGAFKGYSKELDELNGEATAGKTATPQGVPPQGMPPRPMPPMQQGPPPAPAPNLRTPGGMPQEQNRIV